MRKFGDEGDEFVFTSDVLKMLMTKTRRRGITGESEGRESEGRESEGRVRKVREEREGRG